jgi:hypothetical protein
MARTHAIESVKPNGADSGGIGGSDSRFGPETAEPDEAPRRRSVFDDLEAHKDEDDEESEATERPLISIPVRRPSKKDFIRTHPTYQFTASIYEDDVSGEVYYVDPNMRKALRDVQAGMRKVVLVPYVNRRGTVFFWPITTTDKGDWHSTAMKIVHMARERWLRVGSDQAASAYVAYVAKQSYGEPEWPEKSLSELLEIAFGSRYIDSPDHSTVKDILYG